ncbi:MULTISPECIES: GNAT family N-acetyltransferase [unclassified Microbacterium]|uniref:GNAT family N-acetyltransferase n=1 Tax=unclassified Microbacterium TaxID=2609290 RepID=UPI000CFC113B|nr:MULTISPECIES: GNAT family N-acetyltransferase [unclassified Microbacterium]PQZ57453.1 GNAT family N-acetyltransferase [Microbacterium sp. MYb43]PQZ77337.1 GNAT family N-acetyltransferase [Microbacterium sp. MYb40]PRB22750.1 GNAT family N-acetyltransferase [Microbacterium sp. MYb54]PRB28908.1 GNAT family N-acetyltransferase [Microbacterium sp. MYb50]PRB69016.1 GNAT family N-acetyltransferase [Microbacterium sp. MYb24]
MESVTLTTERLVLRAPSEADVDAIANACQDPEIPRWTTVPSPYTRGDAESFVRLVTGSWADDSEYVWGLHADGVLIGMIGLHNIGDHFTGRHAELGYWVTADARGKGYLLEAARAVIDWGFTGLGLARIRWQAVAGNIPSARAARALGFRYEGLQRQALTSPRGRDDGWMAGLLPTDDRTPVDWPILEG